MDNVKVAVLDVFGLGSFVQCSCSIGTSAVQFDSCHHQLTNSLSSSKSVEASMANVQSSTRC